MNNQCRRRRAASKPLKNTHGGWLNMLGQVDQSQILVSQTHHTNASPDFKDKVPTWPADTSSFVKPEPAVSAVNRGLRSNARSTSSECEVALESAVLVHELRQPLSAIVSNAQASLRWLTLEAPNLSAARESAKKIIRDASAAADLMERMRNLFRGTGQQKANVDLNAVVFEVLCRLSDRIDERGIITRTTTASDSTYVNADRIQLEQVLQNLIANAIDAMEETSPADRVLFVYSNRESDGTILVTVEDKGCGLENIDQVFDPFFTTKDNGLGLGLWICRSIIQSHNGKLWAEKVWHGGTRFSFTLPVH